MITYKHFGDLGDIVAALPVIRHLGKGILYIEETKFTRVPLSKAQWRGIDLLLKEQPYIEDVQEWKGQPVSYNLNDWRVRIHMAMRKGQDREKSLLKWQLEQYGIPDSAASEPWLKVEPKKIARVVFNRTGPGRPPHFIYQNREFPWHHVWSKYHKDAVFVGTQDEYEVFSGTCGSVPHVVTKDLYEAARVIAGCDLFVGNQSVCFWLACAIFKPIVLEVWPEGPNCCIHRNNIVLGWNRNVDLPELGYGKT